MLCWLSQVKYGYSTCCGPMYDNSVCIGKVSMGELIYALCEDCTVATPYCGYGSCNIFGCNCDGGCRVMPEECTSSATVENNSTTVENLEKSTHM